jgi:haloacid dehalogenase-like hydrolase
MKPILLIDIDDTLLVFRAVPGVCYSTSSLATVIRRYAVEERGMTEMESMARMEAVRERIAWWSWSDFLDEFHFESGPFWDYAREVESQYLIPAEPGLAATLGRLRETGCSLCITSNNPEDGIRHKLRLAGIARPEELFDVFFSATKLRAMKAEVSYWRKVIEAIGLPLERLYPVGDNPEDDCRVPARAGIRNSFLLRLQKSPECLPAGCRMFAHFRAIEEYLQGVPAGGTGKEIAG